MAKAIAESLRSVDIVVLNRLRALNDGGRCIDPRTVGPELASYLRPVVASSRRVLLHRHGGEPQTFEVRWTPTGVAVRPWFVCTCGRRVRRLYSRDDAWACRYCHRLTYASRMMPDAKHWRGAGALLRALHQIDPTIADPFSPLPPRPRGMWRKKYERLARAVTVAQGQFMRPLVAAANKSIAQQRHQVMYGRLTKQRKELRERALELGAKRKEELGGLRSAMAAVRAGTPIPDIDHLTPEEQRELRELLVRNGRMDDVESFVAANSDRFRMERVRR
jgi:hypothetical protein